MHRSHPSTTYGPRGEEQKKHSCYHTEGETAHAEARAVETAPTQNTSTVEGRGTARAEARTVEDDAHMGHSAHHQRTTSWKRNTTEQTNQKGQGGFYTHSTRKRGVWRGSGVPAKNSKEKTRLATTESLHGQGTCLDTEAAPETLSPKLCVCISKNLRTTARSHARVHDPTCDVTGPRARHLDAVAPHSTLDVRSRLRRR